MGQLRGSEVINTLLKLISLNVIKNYQHTILHSLNAIVNTKFTIKFLWISLKIAFTESVFELGKWVRILLDIDWTIISTVFTNK